MTGDVTDDERAGFRRTIAQRCLFGVDVNPMAVQLGRLSLWLATLAADRPLTFLDHHLRAGNSLVGISLADVANRPPCAARPIRTLPLFDDGEVDAALEATIRPRISITRDPGDTIEQVRAKEQALARIGGATGPLAKWKAVCDLWCACWFGLKEGSKRVCLRRWPTRLPGGWPCSRGGSSRRCSRERVRSPAPNGSSTGRWNSPRSSTRGRGAACLARVRRGRRKPAVGDASRRSGGQLHPRPRTQHVVAPDGIRPRLRSVRTAKWRTGEPVPVVPRARAVARPRRRADRPGAAVGFRIRSRMRGAAAEGARHDMRGHFHIGREP